MAPNSGTPGIGNTIPCTKCTKTYTTTNAFLLTCRICDRTWHHSTCLRPPMTDLELMSRIKNTNRRKTDFCLFDWKCPDCTRIQVGGASSDQPIELDSEEETPTPATHSALPPRNVVEVDLTLADDDDDDDVVEVLEPPSRPSGPSPQTIRRTVPSSSRISAAPPSANVSLPPMPTPGGAPTLARSLGLEAAPAPKAGPSGAVVHRRQTPTSAPAINISPILHSHQSIPVNGPAHPDGAGKRRERTFEPEFTIPTPTLVGRTIAPTPGPTWAVLNEPSPTPPPFSRDISITSPDPPGPSRKISIPSRPTPALVPSKQDGIRVSVIEGVQTKSPEPNAAPEQLPVDPSTPARGRQATTPDSVETPTPLNVSTPSVNIPIPRTLAAYRTTRVIESATPPPARNASVIESDSDRMVAQLSKTLTGRFDKEPIRAASRTGSSLSSFGDLDIRDEADDEMAVEEALVGPSPVKVALGKFTQKSSSPLRMQQEDAVRSVRPGFVSEKAREIEASAAANKAQAARVRRAENSSAPASGRSSAMRGEGIPVSLQPMPPPPPPPPAATGDIQTGDTDGGPLEFEGGPIGRGAFRIQRVKRNTNHTFPVAPVINGSAPNKEDRRRIDQFFDGGRKALEGQALPELKNQRRPRKVTARRRNSDDTGTSIIYLEKSWRDAFVRP